MTEAAVSNDEFTAFWNNVLAAKFDRFRNILLDGLSYHSRVPLQKLQLAPGTRCSMSAAGGATPRSSWRAWSDRPVRVVGFDCCTSFLEQARSDARDAGVSNVRFVDADVQIVPIPAGVRLLLLPLRNDVFQQPGRSRCAISRARSSPAGNSCSSPGGRSTTTRGQPFRRSSFSIFCRRRATKRRPAVPVHSRWRAPRSSPPSSKRRDSTTSASNRSRDPVMVGSTVEQAMQFQMAIGPAGEIVREAGAAAERRRAETACARARALRDGSDHGAAS